MSLNLTKWTEVLNRGVSKEDTQMANKYMKRWLNTADGATLLIIRYMQIRIPVRHHLTPVKMAVIKKNK